MSRSLIFLGVLLLAINSYLYFGTMETNMGELVLRYMSYNIKEDAGLLVFAGIGSWAVPIIMIMIGVSIAKKSMERDKALDKLKPRA